MTEALRLYFVVLAMGFDLPMGISGGLFVALIASLLTAIPFTPAGLGAVEGVVVFILTTLYGATSTQALAIVLVDRAISVLSVIIFGGITYILSDKTKRQRPAPSNRQRAGLARKTTMPVDCLRPASAGRGAGGSAAVLCALGALFI